MQPESSMKGASMPPLPNQITAKLHTGRKMLLLTGCTIDLNSLQLYHVARSFLTMGKLPPACSPKARLDRRQHPWVRVHQCSAFIKALIPKSITVALHIALMECQRVCEKAAGTAHRGRTGTPEIPPQFAISSN